MIKCQKKFKNFFLKIKKILEKQHKFFFLIRSKIPTHKRIILVWSNLVQIYSQPIRRKICKLTDSEETCFIYDYGSGPYKGPRSRSKVR